MATKQVKRNSGALLDVTFYADEATLDADGSVTYAVTKADGTSLSTGNATHVGTAGSGAYRLTLAPQANLNLLTATFTGTFGGIVQSQSVEIDIVGGFYVSLAELRALPNLSDAAKFTTAELVAARHWFETRFERYTRRAFVARYRRLTLISSGEGSLEVPDTDLRVVRSLTVDSSALADVTLAALQFNGSAITPNRLMSSINATWSERAPFGYRGSAVVVSYEYGLDSPPADVRDAALLAIRSHLLADQSGRPMLSIADGAGGTTRFLLPDDNRPFGIPEVDVVANDYRRRDESLTSVPLGCG